MTGLKLIACIFMLGIYNKASFPTNQSAVFPPVHIKPRNFAKRQCKLQVVDPSHIIEYSEARFSSPVQARVCLHCFGFP